jgi:hypothetical protein
MSTANTEGPRGIPERTNHGIEIGPSFSDLLSKNEYTESPTP